MSLCSFISVYFKLFYSLKFVSGCETFEQLLNTFQLCRGMLGEILSAYEFLDSECMRLLNRHLKLPNPISGRHIHHTRMFCLFC